MKIICIGRNYEKHAKELGNEIPKEPVIFIKPSTALNLEDEFYLPQFSQDIHYELELVIRISQSGKKIPVEEAPNYFKEIALGIDFTARDLQSQLKKKGLPWEKAKAFDNSAFLTPFKLIDDLRNNQEIKFKLQKNDAIVQSGSSRDMLFKFDELVSASSKYFTLEQGDLIYTGTPEGVGAVKKGDILKGNLEGDLNFELKIK
ncbi:2-hydroxyhepta-2,4-diene-1,7-dioate isomerase [Flavobacteriaceae bacterium Ap0902]|nr:2-hydroxyhepta-2,4-diene-1,7-dioate isomerase [Flavobacteriaceae bacterium Ap0902]